MTLGASPCCGGIRVATYATEDGSFERIVEDGSTRLIFKGFSGTLTLSSVVKVGEDIFPSGLPVPPAASLRTMPRLPLVAGSNAMPLDLTVSPEVARRFVLDLDEDHADTKKPALQDCTIDDATDSKAVAKDNNPGGEEAMPVERRSRRVRPPMRHFGY